MEKWSGEHLLYNTAGQGPGKTLGLSLSYYAKLWHWNK